MKKLILTTALSAAFILPAMEANSSKMPVGAPEISGKQMLGGHSLGKGYFESATYKEALEKGFTFRSHCVDPNGCVTPDNQTFKYLEVIYIRKTQEETTYYSNGIQVGSEQTIARGEQKIEKQCKALQRGLDRAEKKAAKRAAKEAKRAAKLVRKKNR